MVYKLKSIAYHINELKKDMEEKNKLMKKSKNREEIGFFGKEINFIKKGIAKLNKRSGAIFCNFKQSELNEILISLKWCENHKKICKKTKRKNYLKNAKKKLEGQIQKACH